MPQVYLSESFLERHSHAAFLNEPERRIGKRQDASTFLPISFWSAIAISSYQDIGPQELCEVHTPAPVVLDR